MAGDERSPRKRVVLWEKPPVTCTCRILATGEVEICIACKDVELHCEVFSEPEAAARFALEKMHAYNAG